jgi:hypothetical protein
MASNKLVPLLPVTHRDQDDGRLSALISLPPAEIIRNIDEWAAAHPDVAALPCGDGHSYGEMYASVRAACLKEIGPS